MADQVATACTQPVCEIGKCLWAPIARRINYARKLSKNWEALCEKGSELGIKRNDIVAEINKMNQLKTPTGECDAWIKEVEKMENKIETIKQEFNVEKKCVGGLCPDIFSRIELGEQVVNMIHAIDVLQEKSKFERGFLVDSPPARVQKKPGPDSTLSTSAYHTLATVMDKIGEESTPKIGIWGMGGVGKTTVLQLLNNTPEIAAMFDHVIWVTVSKSPTIRMVQKEVARRLKIVLNEGESDEAIASRLFHELDRKKYLLLLDDVWDTVDLTFVGFPNPNKDNGCKLVLTTRKMEVCRKMRTDTEIPVEVLSEEEALEMFYTNVGDVFKLPAIKELAQSIVKECDGLPLALKVVSGALRKEENVSVWKNFLRELRSPSTCFIEDLDEKVFKVLKVSYDELKNTEKMKCLLFSGLYPEDSEIKKLELIEYLKTEGILSRELTLEQAYDKGEAILQALVDASLLEKCDGDFDNCVKMHDVVRDLVLAMTSPKGGEEPAHLVRAGIFSEKMPEEVEWKKATRISFIDHDLRNLPESPNCPELLTLLLQGNKNLKVIPETFFDNMPKLQVLDLSRTGIKTLPTSMLKLDNLRGLALSDCKNLEALPIGMRLSHIEVFKLTGELSNESADIVTKELSNSSSLSSLTFDFQRVDNLQYFLQHSRPWKQGTLTIFGLGVKDLPMEWHIDKYKRCLSYGGSGGEEMGSGLPPTIEDALNRSNCFILTGQDKQNSLSEVGAHNTYLLRCCKIVNCDALENVTNRNGLQTGAFPNLECLILSNLRNLKSVVCLEKEEGQLLPPTLPNPNIFTNLKQLSLMGCPLIEQIFSSGFMVRQLSNLEVLIVSKCQGLKGMVPDDEKIEYKALPKLRVLWLDRLPEFVSFFKGVPMYWQSLSEVHIVGCPKLRKLPIDSNGSPNLEKIEVEQEWWDSLEWDNDAIKLRLQPLFKTCRIRLDQIEHCHVNTRFSHTLCGQFVTKLPGVSFECNFCRSSCCEAELVRTFHMKITLADETAKVFAWCTGHTASELLHISPDEFCELHEEEQIMYPSSLENEMFTVALVNCRRQGYGPSGSLTEEHGDEVMWEITRALKCE